MTYASNSIPPLAEARPFDIVVIVSPDAELAGAVHDLLVAPPAIETFHASDGESRAAILPNGIMMISTSNPHGCELGSGGAAIAALAEAEGMHRQWKKSSVILEDMRGRRRAPDGAAATGAAETSSPTVLILRAESRGVLAQPAMGTLQTGTAWKALPVGRVRASITTNDDGGGRTSPLTACAVIARPSYEPTSSNPVTMLVHSLSIVFRDVPKGSVVVVADSDVVLSFNDSYHPTRVHSDFDDEETKIGFDELRDENDSVVGLAVPFPAQSVKQARVHVLESNATIANERRWRVTPTSRLLPSPKPNQWPGAANANGNSNKERAAESIQGEMRSLKCTFYMTDQPVLYMAQNSDREMAWVDVGVVAFLPGAANSLRELSLSTLRCCTRSGLKDMYEGRYSAGRPTSEETPSPEEFARRTSCEVCLYDDILQALRNPASGPMGTDNYSDILNTLGFALSGSAGARAPPDLTRINAPPGLAETNVILGLGGNDAPPGGALREALSMKLLRHTLYTCAIPTGSLFRLGSAGQLVDCLTSGVSISMGPAIPTQVSGFDQHRMGQPVKPKTALFNGLFRGPRIGEGSVMEHCHLDCAPRIKVGERCFLGGIRQPLAGSSLRVPAGMSIQLLPLRRSFDDTEPAPASTDDEEEAERERSFVCICLGVEDRIANAPAETVYGLDLKKVLQRSGLIEFDLWDGSIPPSRRALWNARMHPVLSVKAVDCCDGGGLDLSFLEWITCLEKSCNRLDGCMTAEGIKGLERWIEARRLSLSEIRLMVDVAAEERYRSSIPLPAGS